MFDFYKVNFEVKIRQICETIKAEKFHFVTIEAGCFNYSKDVSSRVSSTFIILTQC